MIKYYCPHCSQKLGVPDNYAGHRVRCSKCSEPSVVPAAALEVFEPVEEPSAASAAPRRHDAVSSRCSVSSSHAMEANGMEDGLDPLALAAARAAHERKHAKALLQATSSGGSTSLPLFGFGAFSLPVRILLSLGTSIALAIAVGLLWAWVASASGWIFGIFSFLSAGAAAWGLTLYTGYRNVGLGVLAVVLGFGSILFGKYMVGRWAIMPMLQEHYEEQMAQGGGFNLMTPEQLGEMLSDDEQMLSIACASLIRSGDVEEMQGRQFIVAQQTKGLEPANLTDEQLSQIRQQAIFQRDGWNEEQRKEAVFRHSQYVFYTFLTSSRTGKAVSQGIAFAGAFSFLDLILIPMSLAVAFKTGTGRS